MFLSPLSGLTETKMQDVIGILLVLTGAASGSLLQDPVVCGFTDSNQCYVALGKRLHLKMTQESGLTLIFTDRTNTTRQLLKYRKTQTNSTVKDPRWQFVNDNKTMILTSAERSDSGTYTLETNDEKGNTKGNYNLQLNIEVEVSSVKVSSSCLSPGVMNVSCSADGENLRFSWTSDSHTEPQLENENRTLILDKTHEGNVTCHVENNVSRDQHTTKLNSCPEPTTMTSTVETSPNNSPLSTLGMISTVSHNETSSSTQSPQNKSLFLYYTLIILSSICVLLIIVSIITFYIYKKRQGQKNTEAPSQEGRELVYAQVTHSHTDRTETRPNTRAQDEDVEYASVVTRSKKKKEKMKEDELQYGELVFNPPAKSKHGTAKVKDECVYSQIHHAR